MVHHATACFVLTAAISLAPSVLVVGQDPASNEREGLVPPRLLPLLHAPEVQQELKLTENQVAELEELFAEIDGRWFRSRIASADERRQVIDQLEQRVHQWFERHASKQQHRRLRELEVQAQSLRSLLRDDVAKFLGLDETQLQELTALARKTDEAHAKLSAAKLRGEATEELEATAKRRVDIEQDSLTEIVKPAQLQKISTLTGERFDTQNLERVYPMAPEFAPGAEWLNSEPLLLRDLRGKVVLVHFYAFQCHNCHANFDVYRRWHEELTDRGVVVIGIQTPETSREREPEAVKAAAAERDLDFPIILDLESQNWDNFGNTMWPTVYVIDKNGYLRYWWQGELRWKGATGDQTVESLVERLLQEPAQGS